MAATGSVEAVHDLAELISLCAQARAQDGPGEAEAWAATAARLGLGGLDEARRALREHGDPSKLDEAARLAAGDVAVERHVLRTQAGWGSIAPMLAALWLVADAASEGRKVVLWMLVVGLVFIGGDRARRADALPVREAQGLEAGPHAVAGGEPCLLPLQRRPRLTGRWPARPPTSAPGSPTSSRKAS